MFGVVILGGKLTRIQKRIGLLASDVVVSHWLALGECNSRTETKRFGH